MQSEKLAQDAPLPCQLEHVSPTGDLLLRIAGTHVSARLADLAWPGPEHPAAERLADYLQQLASDGHLSVRVIRPATPARVRLAIDGRDVADYVTEIWSTQRAA